MFIAEGGTGWGGGGGGEGEARGQDALKWCCHGRPAIGGRPSCAGGERRASPPEERFGRVLCRHNNKRMGTFSLRVIVHFGSDVCTPRAPSAERVGRDFDCHEEKVNDPTRPCRAARSIFWCAEVRRA
jgi:hypothetical protein